MEQFAPVKRSEDGQAVRYLIVDDSVFARKNLVRMVESFGGQVVGEAGDGVSAISEYERLTPDIVLMDIRLPDQSGITACQQVRQRWPAVSPIRNRCRSWRRAWRHAPSSRWRGKCAPCSRTWTTPACWPTSASMRWILSNILADH